VSTVPGEDLVIMARDLAANYHEQLNAPDWTAEVGPDDWRYFVDADVRRYWGRTDYGERLLAWLIAARMAKRVRDRRAARDPTRSRL
jgi:hypothetical protein